MDKIMDYDELDHVIGIARDIWLRAVQLAPALIAADEAQDFDGEAYKRLGKIIEEAGYFADTLTDEAEVDFIVPEWCDPKDPTDRGHLANTKSDPLELAAIAAYTAVREWLTCVETPAWDACTGIMHELESAWNKLIGLRIQYHGEPPVDPVGFTERLRLKAEDLQAQNARLRKEAEKATALMESKVIGMRKGASKTQSNARENHRRIRQVWAQMIAEAAATNGQALQKNFCHHWPEEWGKCPGPRTVGKVLNTPEDDPLDGLLA